MEEKPRLLVYTRKEVIVLTLLGGMIAFFSFTLGVHLGKSVGGKGTAAQESAPVPLAESTHDTVPTRQELDEKSKVAEDNADESMSKALHDEVTKTGVRVDVPHQVDLPTKTVAENKGSNTQAQESGEHAVSETSGAKFTLQIGSYPTMNEAQELVRQLSEKGLELSVKGVEVQGKGKRFRVLTGRFSQKNQALAAGKAFVSKGTIQSFVVVPLR